MKAPRTRVAIELDRANCEYIVVEYTRTGWRVLYRCEEHSDAHHWRKRYLAP